MKNLKTIGKAVVLTALVATQANAFTVPGWDWVNSKVVKPVSERATKAGQWIKGIQWKDKIEQQVGETGFDAQGDYAERSVDKVVAPGIVTKAKDGVRAAKDAVVNFAVNNYKKTAEKVAKLNEENPKAKWIVAGTAVVATVAAVSYIVVSFFKKDKKKEEKK